MSAKTVVDCGCGSTLESNTVSTSIQAKKMVPPAKTHSCDVAPPKTMATARTLFWSTLMVNWWSFRTDIGHRSGSDNNEQTDTTRRGSSNMLRNVHGAVFLSRAPTTLFTRPCSIPSWPFVDEGQGRQREIPPVTFNGEKIHSASSWYIGRNGGSGTGQRAYQNSHALSTGWSIPAVQHELQKMTQAVPVGILNDILGTFIFTMKTTMKIQERRHQLTCITLPPEGLVHEDNREVPSQGSLKKKRYQGARIRYTNRIQQFIGHSEN